MEKDFELLNKINSPDDLKKCTISQLPEVCKELRQFIIQELSENPGHLAASLGTVELSVALHYTLHTPYDRIVWDVGHQAYGHKILTGRRDKFNTNRKLNGISGFPNPSESAYDAFIAGHASNSISAALGIDIAAHFQKEKRVVAAVIGDGAMTGGLAYEGLNNISEYDNNVLIILNDNKYSIDKNIGGISKYLSHISTSKHYNNFRWYIYRAMRKLGLMSNAQKNRILRLNNNIKGLFNNQQNSLFDGFDIRYFGPVDGHDVKNLVRVLNTIKDMTGPKVLHIRTIKGKGYEPAENDATRFHAPGKFDIITGKSTATPKEGNEPIKFQEVFGQTITELAEKNDKIVAVTPAMPTGCGLHTMMSRFPGRVFDVGIAEGHAVTFSAGLAKEGMIPFCNIYSSFAQRAYDNIIHDVAIPKLPVILCLDRAGLVGEDGVTHQGAFDIAFLRCIPNLTIASPINEHEFRNLMFTAQKLADRPFVIRYPRGKGFVVNWKNEMQEIPVGKGHRLTEGKDIAVATIGPIGLTVQKIIEDFKQENISLSVALYDFRFIKPIDRDLVREIGRNFQKVLTIENGAIEGGFGSALMECFSEEGYCPQIYRIGIPDRFIEHANVAQQHQMCGMDEADIRKVLLNL